MKKIAFVAVLIAVIVFGIVAYAFALSGTKTVTIDAKVNPKFALTVTPSGGSPDIDWTNAVVGTPLTSNVAVKVDSNRTGILTAAWAVAPAAAWHMSRTLTTANFTQNPDTNALNQFTDTITFAPAYDTPSTTSTTSFQVVYSAVQN